MSDGSTGGAAAGVPAPPSLNRGENRATGTATNYDATIVYINMFLTEKGYPEFDELTTTHVQGDHMRHYFECIVNFIAKGTFVYGKTSAGEDKTIGLDTKVKHFDRVKAVFKQKFPTHELWKDNQFFSETKEWFKTSCGRKKVEDPTVVGQMKSAPLYRDLSNSAGLIRSKYLKGPYQTVLDQKQIAMAMIEDGSKDACSKLAEINLIAAAIGRGGKTMFLRYKGSNFDPFFHALDMDWPLIKQTDEQCMLFFNDREDYCLDVYFGLAVYWLHGGLRRDGVDAAISDYVFPELFKKQKKNVAKGNTDALQKYSKRVLIEKAKAENNGRVPNSSEMQLIDTKAKSITTRSLRKAGMTQNRANRELSTQEEYCRSGHNAPEMNGNAEVYVERTGAMNAPAGRAMAGYKDPHAECFPYSFECLGSSVEVVLSVN